MKIVLFALALVLVGSLLSPPPAAAGERDATSAERARVVEALSRLGYRNVRDVDVVGGTFEADATSPEGRDVDVILDRETVRVVRVEAS